jgi:hypothetical protein
MPQHKIRIVIAACSRNTMKTPNWSWPETWLSFSGTSKNVLPPFINIRCFSLVKQMYPDIC